MANIGETIRRERERLGLSQDALADGMVARGFPFHQATVYKIEKSTRPVRVEEAVALAELLNMSLSELVGVPGMADEAVIERRQAQLELARLDTALYRALDEFNDAQRKLNALVPGTDPDAGVLKLVAVLDEGDVK